MGGTDLTYQPTYLRTKACLLRAHAEHAWCLCRPWPSLSKLPSLATLDSLSFHLMQINTEIFCKDCWGSRTLGTLIFFSTVFKGNCGSFHIVWGSSGCFITCLFSPSVPSTTSDWYVGHHVLASPQEDISSPVTTNTPLRQTCTCSTSYDACSGWEEGRGRGEQRAGKKIRITIGRWKILIMTFNVSKKINFSRCDSC